MLVLVDVDLPVVKIHDEWLRLYNKAYDDNLKVKDITDWDALITKSKAGVKIFEFLPFVYANSPPTKGALEGIKTLRNLGHKVVFVTSGIYVEKISWLFKYGFSISKSEDTPKDIIIASDKSLIVGDVLIDDYQENLIGRKYPILFDAPWNRHVDGYPRAFDWQDVIEMIEEIS